MEIKTLFIPEMGELTEENTVPLMKSYCILADCDKDCEACLFNSKNEEVQVVFFKWIKGAIDHEEITNHSEHTH